MLWRVDHRWVVLAVSTAAQASTAAYFLGLAAITPALRAYYDLSLPAVGLLIGVMSAGILVTLIAWGSATDRFGERPVMVVGLVGAAAFLAATAAQRDPVLVGALLIGAGGAGASVNAASGRAVLTWFPATQRGLAMAVRQTSVPLGTALASVALPAVVGVGGVPAVFLTLAGGAALVAVAVALWVRDPPDGEARSPQRADRPAAADVVDARSMDTPDAADKLDARGPVRATLADRRLWRLAAAAGLLVVPQFIGSVFLVELLHTGHGLALAAASGLLALTQLLGAAGRLGAGFWSDRAGSRLGPLRTVALLIAGGFTAAALAAAPVTAIPVGVLAAVFVPAAAAAISWNGLAFTATGEMVPRHRVGTALAFENSANYLSGAATPLLAGLAAQLAGFPAMLLVGAVAATASWWLLAPLAAAEPVPE